METVQFVFPAPQGSGDNLGLNKLEYFTAHAMQGLLASGKSFYVQDAISIAKEILEHLNNPPKINPSGAV
jgi:hypothetical protein